MYVEEMGFILWTKHSYGRSSVGERAHRFVGRNATVIAAIAGSAVILYYELNFGNVNVEKFQIFMVSFEEIPGFAHVAVVTDNASLYRGVCESLSDLNLNFLPPYLPFFIPNEICFLVFKSSLKQHIGNEVDRCTSERAR